MKDSIYFKQVELLLNILPHIDKFTDFALKGGTAINFFIRNLPRLSVDIDLTYLPITPRDQALAAISSNLILFSQDLIRRIPDLKVTPKIIRGTKAIKALIVNRRGVTVKIEPNLVIRGAVFPAAKRELCQAAQQKFELITAVNTLSFADLFGGKICAALDRQHPRDFYDIYFLIQNEGLTENIRKAFIVYLLSHPRPMIELLDPRPHDFRKIYNLELKGMIFKDVSLNDLVETRDYLIKTMKTWLLIDEKKFLLSIKNMKPDWELLGIKNVRNFPAVKWKLLNIKKMSRTKHAQALKKLKTFLEL